MCLFQTTPLASVMIKLPAGYTLSNGNADQCLKYMGKHCMAISMV